jgi:hypothetical protein
MLKTNTVKKENPNSHKGLPDKLENKGVEVQPIIDLDKFKELVGKLIKQTYIVEVFEKEKPKAKKTDKK